MPKPVALHLHRRSAILDIRFDDGKQASLSCEYLRVYSPSAEVRGHGQGPGTLITGKENITILDITQVGQYAVKLLFSDGHDTGLYTWDYLYALTIHYEENWSLYRSRLTAVGYTRTIK